MSSNISANNNIIQLTKDARLEPVSAILPPHNREAEMAVLGAVMVEPKSIVVLQEAGLKPEHFYIEAHQIIYNAYLQMQEQKWTTGIIETSNFLQQIGKLSVVGGMEYLDALQESVPTTANIASYARIIMECFYKRRLQKTLYEINEMLSRSECSFAEILEKSKTKFLDNATVGSEHLQQFCSILQSELIRMEKICSGQEEDKVVWTGFKDLDNILDGIRPGEVMVIGGYTSHGKTAFALNLMTKMAMEQNIGSVFFAVEPTETSVVNRIVACEAGIEHRRLQHPARLSNEDLSRIYEVANRMWQHRNTMVFDFTKKLSTPLIWSKLKLEKEKNPAIQGFFVDYLQKVHPKRYTWNTTREREVAMVSHELNIIAKELNLFAIVLSQVNENVKARKSNELFLGDIRESRTIEQDANVVAFLYYDEGEEEKVKSVVNIKIAKNRDRTKGYCKLIYNKPYQRFENYVERYEDIEGVCYE